MKSPRAAAWKGMNWIRQERRLAVYLRDGLACVWCGDAVEDGVQLQLDHLRSPLRGGTHHASNLVTACAFCNKSRGTKTVSRFAASALVARRVRRQAARPLDLAEAKRLIALRGSAARAVAASR